MQAQNGTNWPSHNLSSLKTHQKYIEKCVESKMLKNKAIYEQNIS